MALHTWTGIESAGTSKSAVRLPIQDEIALKAGVGNWGSWAWTLNKSEPSDTTSQWSSDTPN